MYIFMNSVANAAYWCSAPDIFTSHYSHESVWMVPGTVDPLED